MTKFHRESSFATAADEGQSSLPSPLICHESSQIHLPAIHRANLLGAPLLPSACETPAATTWLQKRRDVRNCAHTRASLRPHRTMRSPRVVCPSTLQKMGAGTSVFFPPFVQGFFCFALGQVWRVPIEHPENF